MPQLIFEAETHAELVTQVRRWLATSESAAEGTRISMSDAVTQGAGLTKDALRIVAAAAPTPVSQNELVKSLADMGYKATDVTSKAMSGTSESTYSRLARRKASMPSTERFACARRSLRSARRARGCSAGWRGAPSVTGAR